MSFAPELQDHHAKHKAGTWEDKELDEHWEQNTAPLYRLTELN
jgi:hypothetical protein